VNRRSPAVEAVTSMMLESGFPGGPDHEPMAAPFDPYTSSEALE
jgi:hypothetical protein